MYYTIYKTTNIINGKFYIGKHQTKDLNDGYIGSGRLLKQAISKYGIDNFHTEILHICKDVKHMNLLEKILVVPDAETNYNLCPGGHGGFGYINKNDYGDKSKAGKLGFIKFEQIMLNKHGPKWRSVINKGRDISHLDKYRRTDAFLGKKHTEETKKKIGQSNSFHQAGTKNSQYGTCWITNGVENKKIKKEDLDSWIELGYSKGRCTI